MHIRRILMETRERNGIAVVGWGAHGSFRGRDRQALRIAAEVGVKVYCLGITKTGHPRHPLYVSYARQPVKLIAAA
jgi:hypothetical protein